jgi:insertion element IS1 protein InsB
MELDEQWSYVGNKKCQRWLWLAIDHDKHDIVAYEFGPRSDETFLKLKRRLEGIKTGIFYTDDWGAYGRNLDEKYHIVGKQYTQAIERQNLDFRTRVKRLTRKTICFSKSEKMHDTVIGLFINECKFSRPSNYNQRL